jgi:hypothetical protein
MSAGASMSTGAHARAASTASAPPSSPSPWQFDRRERGPPNRPSRAPLARARARRAPALRSRMQHSPTH